MYQHIIFHNVILVEILKFSRKCLHTKKVNIVQKFNTENKYLYGKLLETQKQRRKLIRKVLGSCPPDDKEISSGNQDSFKDTKKILREKIIKVNVVEHSVSSSPEVITLTNSELPKENKLLEESEPAITSENEVLKSLKKYKIRTKNNNSEESLSVISSSTDNFKFSSNVPINDINYPLENAEKSNNFSVENVLSYKFRDSVVKDYLKFPSVSKIIEETMSENQKLVLKKWRENLIKDLGEDGFNEYSKDLKQRGSDFHSAVRDALLGRPAAKHSEVTLNALRSLQWLLKHVSSPAAVESITAHPTLGYKGIPDCVAVFRNTPVVVDWKLSDKAKKELKDTYDAPVQITAYIGALNHDPNYKWTVNHGLVAVAYTSGEPCDVFLLAPKHCQIYWRLWLARFHKFKGRSHLHLDHNIDEKALQ